MNKEFRLLFFVALLILSSIGSAFAQTTTGSISGTVTDERQAVVTAATVTARNTDTGLSRTNQTDSEGRYNFANLPIGAYEITVEAANFSKYVQTGSHCSSTKPPSLMSGLKPAACRKSSR